MGIHDRDYARPGSSAPGPGAMTTLVRKFTAVQWLVIINIAVFVIDALIGARNPVITHMGSFTTANPPANSVVDRSRAFVDQQTGYEFFPIRDAATQEAVGQWRFTRMAPLQSIGHFSTAMGFFGLEVWRLLSFQFLHGSVNHLLFNMIGLWVFGPLVEQHLGSRRKFLAYYLVSGIFGAVLYLILNLAGSFAGAHKPFLLINDVYTPLIGASAGVFGVLMASAFIAGDAIMLLFFVLPMRIRHGAWLMFLFALGNLLVGGSNAGGDAAHVGGAIAGYFFIRRPHLLVDFFDVLGPRDPSRARRGAPEARKTKSRPGWLEKLLPARKPDQERLDELLDKIREKGLHSLSAGEKRFLQSQSDKHKDQP